MIPSQVYEKSLRSFLEPILSYLDDPSVSEVMINGPERIYVERRGQLSRVDARFASQEALLSALRNIAQFVGRPLDAYHPILEGRLPDGSRIEALLPPISPDGPSVAIRRFARDTLTIEKLLALGSLTPDAAQLLSALVAAKQNVVVSGGTGSGKTSLLNCLSSFIPESDRVVVIEDARELQLQQAHVVQLEGRPADARGKGQITIRDLFKATLRMRPDRIVVGEIRGGEALELIQAMTSGHGGCMSTVHASYPKDALARLETMALMSSVELPLTALRSQISSAIDIIVQVGRVRDGSRRLTHITEVLGCDERNQYQLQDLFVLEHGDMAHHGEAHRGEAHRGEAHRGEHAPRPELVPTGVLPACVEAIRMHGHDLPQAVYAAANRRQR